MRVELISYTRDPERTIAAAMRLCYSASDIDNILEAIDDTEAERLIGKVLKLGHLSVLEHASFTFAIEGISRACSHQLIRHRMASFSQQSQRYVKMRDFEYTIPPSIEKNEEALSIYNDSMRSLQSKYDAYLATGISAEDARYILPNAAETKLIMTANARSLLNFFELRLCTRAQWEIRRLAGMMLKEVRAVAPVIFKMAGPVCEVKGYCREVDMSCGRAAPMPVPDNSGEE
ncbi:MAG: FAD-dependent thymidylate synthase [Armatimonadota bacterium]